MRESCIFEARGKCQGKQESQEGGRGWWAGKIRPGQHCLVKLNVKTERRCGSALQPWNGTAGFRSFCYLFPRPEFCWFSQFCSWNQVCKVIRLKKLQKYHLKYHPLYFNRSILGFLCGCISGWVGAAKGAAAFPSHLPVVCMHSEWTKGRWAAEYTSGGVKPKEKKSEHRALRKQLRSPDPSKGN